MIRVEVKPELLSWARERAGFDPGALAHRFPKLAAWEQGTAHPTLKQIEKFANATHTPIGFLFLQQPPVEHIPIPDFRTAGNKRIGRPSPDLLETIYVCQQRQEWYRDFSRSERESPLSFVGSASLNSNVEMTAESMRHQNLVANLLDAEYLLHGVARDQPVATGQSYEPAAVNTFLQVADCYLVAHALAHGDTVVTHEKPSTSTKKIKIPEACIGLGIKCVTPYEMLRTERARFVLGPQK